MTPVSSVLIFIALAAFVAGQIVLKKAMESSHAIGFGSRKFIWLFSSGIVFMTISFFLILGLLQRYDLSYIYPFQGFNVILISLAAALVLRERLTLQMIVGAALISAGIVLVSIS